MRAIRENIVVGAKGREWGLRSPGGGWGSMFRGMVLAFVGFEWGLILVSASLSNINSYRNGFVGERGCANVIIAACST